MIALMTGIAALVLALNGWLYQPKRDSNGPSQWSNYTTWERTLLFLIVATNITAIATGWLDNKSKEAAATEAKDQLKRQEATMNDLQQKVTYLNVTNSRLQGKLDSYQIFLERLGRQSERQPQMVMAQFVQLRPGKSWSAPNNLHSGSYVEFYGWDQPIVLTYGDRSERIPPVGWATPAKVAVVGNSGETFKWSVRNIGSSDAGGKVLVFSTPRSRSVEWSWLEEEIAKLPNR